MPFELWRQDDNGRQFLVGVYPNREEAERWLAQLSRMQHKQISWITDSEERQDPPEPP